MALRDLLDHRGELAAITAASLFQSGSFATAMFLAITALEETAKIHVGMYRRSEEFTGRRDDPLYLHKDKHFLGAAPTIPMGSRLSDALGDEKVRQLIALARSGRLVGLREQCLYVESQAAQLLVPGERITRDEARSILLFSIESFDDALVGYTNHSLEVGRRADALFALVRQSA